MEKALFALAKPSLKSQDITKLSPRRPILVQQAGCQQIYHLLFQ